MRIEERKVTVGEVCDGYFNDAEEGVVGYGERLDIRPRFRDYTSTLMRYGKKFVVIGDDKGRKYAEIQPMPQSTTRPYPASSSRALRCG